MSMALTAPPGRKRFLIVACLFIGIFIAYLDRVNVSVLAANEPFLAYMGIEGMPLQIGMMYRCLRRVTSLCVFITHWATDFGREKRHACIANLGQSP